MATGMTRRECIEHGLKLAGALSLGTGPSHSAGASSLTDQSFSGNRSGHPNVIVIFPDQMRRQALGFWNREEHRGCLNGVSDPVLTPHLDALAANSFVSSSAVSNDPLCSPFRGMLLTGASPWVNGLTGNCEIKSTVTLSWASECITETFSQAGYHTAYVGKCHWIRNLPLFDENGVYTGAQISPGGHYINEYDTYVPPEERRGIHYFCQTVGDHHNLVNAYSNDAYTVNWNSDGSPFRKRAYTGHYEADVVCDYLNNTRSQRPNDRPFFLIWSLNPPHPPYCSVDDTIGAQYWQHYGLGAVEDVRTLLNRPNVDLSTAKSSVRSYFSNISAVDECIGRVLQTLNRSGMAENTIVLFTSDHGEMMGSHGLMGKNVYFEESLGVPWMVSWPGKIAPRVEPLMTGAMDIFPTLLGLARLKQKQPSSVQGEDWSELVLGKDQSMADSVVFWSHLTNQQKNNRGVRTDSYLYVVEGHGEEYQLVIYDLRNDPYQQHNLSPDQIPVERLQWLKSELGNLLARYDDPWFQEHKYTAAIHYPQ